MSLNPLIGHLYHDFSITNSYTVLDAREKMRTREINARETKYLDKYACSLDKAKLICQNNNEREQRNIRKHLDNITAKTVSLEKGLKRESQRLKLFDDVIHVAYKTTKSTVLRKSRQTITNKQRHNFVSAKSLYRNIHTEQRNNVQEVERDSVTNQKRTVLPSNTVKLLRKADSITKTLHTLYTKKLEKRWKHTNRTISDVLNSESNEELEKALFVLRGTHAGTLIEDILRERAWIRRNRPESYKSRNWSQSSSDSNHGNNDYVGDNVFVTELNVRDGMERMSLVADNKTNTLAHSSEQLNKLPKVSNGANWNNKIETEIQGTSIPVGNNMTIKADNDCVDEISSDEKTELPEIIATNPWQSVSLSQVSDKTKDNDVRSWINISDVNLDIKDIFERDDPDSMSSTIVNPSENEYAPTMKWREIFKTPEVWKQTKLVAQKIKKPTPISLVKVHGQYRQTMLK